MKTQSEDESESHEIVDKLEEREMLWNQFTQRSDCEHCPRKSLLRFKLSSCLRCFEEHRKRLAGQPSS